MIAQLRVAALAETSFYKDWIACGTALGLPENSHSEIPRDRIRPLSFCGASSVSIEEFLRLWARVNALRSATGSLRCVSSGINSDASFCSLLGRSFFPPIADSVILRGSSFGHGRTFRNYLVRLKKTCVLSDCSFYWYTPTVREIAKGLSFAKQPPVKFPNFIYTQDLYRVINFLRLLDSFAQLAF